MEKHFQRWTAKRKVELLLQLIKGETMLVDARHEHDLTQSEVEGWMAVLLRGRATAQGARGGMSSSATSGKCASSAPVGELVLELEPQKAGRPHPEPEKAF